MISFKPSGPYAFSLEFGGKLSGFGNCPRYRKSMRSLRINPFKPSGVKLLYFRVVKAILV